MAKSAKRALYEEKVGPIVAELVHVCGEFDIPFLAVFQYGVSQSEAETIFHLCATARIFENEAVAPLLCALFDGCKGIFREVPNNA